MFFKFYSQNSQIISRVFTIKIKKSTDFTPQKRVMLTEAFYVA